MTQVIVALDVDTLKQEDQLLQELKDTITFYKVGLQLFTAHGKRAVDLVHRHGGKVFLDLKLHDIPQTVVHAVRCAHQLGAHAVSLHLSGGRDMLRAAAEVGPRPKLWGVTVLTSLQDSDLKPWHPQAKVAAAVKNLAQLGWASGIDGTICSGQEVGLLRKALANRETTFITPGIRPAQGQLHDQKRVMTPEQAALAAIDYIVIGRPITQAANPLRAAQDILASMQHAAPQSLRERS